VYRRIFSDHADCDGMHCCVVCDSVFVCSTCMSFFFIVTIFILILLTILLHLLLITYCLTIIYRSLSEDEVLLNMFCLCIYIYTNVYIVYNNIYRPIYD